MSKLYPSLINKIERVLDTRDPIEPGQHSTKSSAGSPEQTLSKSRQRISPRLTHATRGPHKSEKLAKDSTA